MAEYWDLYNKKREKLDQVGVRGIELREGQYHLVVFAWLKNPNGVYLISKRSENKIGAGLWETVAGSATKGESSEEAIIREVYEEVGINVEQGKGQLKCTVVHESQSSWFGDHWFFEIDIEIDNVVCQEEEVSEVRWASKEDIVSLMKTGHFFNSKIHLDNRVDEML